jgi:hypothetical protein
VRRNAVPNERDEPAARLRVWHEDRKLLVAREPPPAELHRRDTRLLGQDDVRVFPNLRHAAHSHFQLNQSRFRKVPCVERHHSHPPLQHPEGRLLGLRRRSPGVPVVIIISLLVVVRAVVAVAVGGLVAPGLLSSRARPASLPVACSRYSRRYDPLLAR